MARINPSSAKPLVFGGTAGMHLSSGVCEYLGLDEGRLEISSFSDGESWVKILDNVRGVDCYVLQATCPRNQNYRTTLPSSRGSPSITRILTSIRAEQDRAVPFRPSDGH